MCRINPVSDFQIHFCRWFYPTKNIGLELTRQNKVELNALIYLYTMGKFPQPAKDFIPQQYPFQFIDDIIDCDEEKTICTFRIPENHVMCDEDGLSEQALLEVMAQTAAAGAGYRAQFLGKGIQKGFIGAIKHIQIHQRPLARTLIRAEVRPLHQIGQSSIVQAKTFLGDLEIAYCELTIFIDI